MLILTRNINETVVIGDDIRVTVINIVNGQVRLGVEAPKDVVIYREEFYEETQRILKTSSD